MIKVLHIAAHLGGGVGRVLTNYLTKSLSFNHYGHEIVCFEQVDSGIKNRFQAENICVTDQCDCRYDFVKEKIVRADIVNIHYWNHPLLLDFIFSNGMPPARMLFWSHVSGFSAPQVFTRELIDYADFFVISTPNSYNNEVIKDLPVKIAEQKIRLVFSCAGIDHIKDVRPKPHKGFNIGYIGTVNYYKMHPSFVSMNARVNIPDVKFLVAGGDKENVVINQARELGVSEKFDIKGYVPDIKPLLEILDVFGYPLCREHYGTGEQSLIEALAVGIPAVVFNNGSEKYVVDDGETGLVVSNETEYIEALEYLYQHPDIRKELSDNARAKSRERFDITKTVSKWHRLYDILMKSPKQPRCLSLAESASGSNTSGAGLFLASLGPYGDMFEKSMNAPTDDITLAAEKSIGELHPLFKAETRGSVLHYRKFYPGDGYLNLWSGLICFKEHRYHEALTAFQTAEKHIDHWRLPWYLSLTYERLGEKEQAINTLEGVLRLYPDFSEADEKLRILRETD